MRFLAALLVGLVPVASAFAAEEGKQAEAAAPFDELTAKITCNWFREARWVVVKGGGEVEFSLRERPGGKAIYTSAFRLGDAHRRELERLLAATEWLAKPLNDLRKIEDAVELDVALSRGGQTRRLHCYGDPPEPYGPLAVFLLRIHHQEHLLYRLTQGTPDDRLFASREVAQELRSIEGDPLLTPKEFAARHGRPGPPRPLSVLDFERLAAAFADVVAHPEGRRTDEIVAAVQLLGYLRVEAQRDSIAAMARYADPEVRLAVIRAMLRFGGPQERDVVAALSKDHDRGVRDGVTEALFRLEGPKAIPLLTEMLPQTPRAAYVLVRMGKEAVPAMAEILEPQPDMASSMSAVHLIRAHLDHQDELPGPVDPRLVKAVEKNLGFYGTPWCAYAVQFLRLARPDQAVAAQALMEVPWSDASGGLKCRLLPGSQTVIVPEGKGPEEIEVEVLYELHNASDQPVKFHKGGTPLEAGNRDCLFNVYGPDGRFARYWGPGKSGPWRKESFLTVEPGQTLSQRFRLPHDFTRPGRYDVQITLPRWVRPESSPLRFYYNGDAELIKLNPANVWGGQLISNVVIVNIARPAAPAAKGK